MISMQSSTHSSQMKTVGPAMSLRTSCWLFPQKEQYRVDFESPLAALVMVASYSQAERPKAPRHASDRLPTDSRKGVHPPRLRAASCLNLDIPRLSPRSQARLDKGAYATWERRRLNASRPFFRKGPASGRS